MADLDIYLGTTDGLLRPGQRSESYLRGHLTRDECAFHLEAHDLAPTGEPLHTWARRGLWRDEDGDLRTGGLSVRASHAGKRGSFRVTVIDVEGAK